MITDQMSIRRRIKPPRLSKAPAILPVIACILSLAPPSRAAIVEFVGSWSPGTAIPDNDANGLLFSQTIDPDFRTIGSVTVNFHTTSGWNGDLYSYLGHTSGMTVLLNRAGTTDASSDAGSPSSGFNVTFSAGASTDIHTGIPSSGAVTGTWQPDGRNVDPAVVLATSPRTAVLSSFNGLDPSGEWHLFAADVSAGETATLTSWGITVRPPDFLTVNSGTTTFSNTKNAYNGPVTVNSGGTLEVATGGTMTAMTEININGGTLLLSGTGTERINNGAGEAPFTLSGAGKITVSSTGSLTESFGALTLTSGGVIDFGSGGGRVNFAASNANPWSGLLSVWNWSGVSTDLLYFGTSSGGLTSTQLDNVRFFSDSGSTFLGSAGQLGDGELVPVPEASSLAMPVLLIACAFWRERRTNDRCLRSRNCAA